MYSLLTLIHCHLNFPAIKRFLLDDAWRSSLLKTKGLDEDIVKYFHHRFNETPKRFLDTSFIDPVYNRSLLLTLPPALKNCLSTRGMLNVPSMMDNGISVVFDLGGIDEYSKRFIGSILFSAIVMAFNARLDTEKRINNYHVLIDEAPLFVETSHKSFTQILSEHRKAGATFLLSQQYLQQTKEMEGALQNSMTLFGRLGAQDALVAAQRYYKKETAEPTSLMHDLFGDDDDEHKQGSPVFAYAGKYIQENIQAARELFETLPPGQMFVRIGNTPHLVQTPYLPPPAVSKEQIKEIEDQYAQALYQEPIVEKPQEERIPDTSSRTASHAPHISLVEPPENEEKRKRAQRRAN